MKQCRACHVEKSLADFYGDGRGGLFARCKDCFNAAQRKSYYANIDKRRASARLNSQQYRRIHPEAETAAARRPERQREYQKHRDVIVARARQWRKDHPGTSWKMVQAWMRKNETNRRRYLHGKLVKEARRRDRGGVSNLKPRDIQQMLDDQQWLCAYCRCSLHEVPYELEHRTPISRGGRSILDNLCMACSPCNRRKHNQTAEEFQAA